MRHNLEKYQKRRRIRDEWKKRIDAIRQKSISNQREYGKIITEYWIVTQKIRRHYPWRQMITGRMC